MTRSFFRRRKFSKDLKAVTEVAGDQITPGLGTFALVLGGLAMAGVAAYAFHLRRQGRNPLREEEASARQAGHAGTGRQR